MAAAAGSRKMSGAPGYWKNNRADFMFKGGITMRIITISREFGSGGRELGKRLADVMDIPCYDHEIIEMVAGRHGFDPNYVSHVSERDIRVFYPTTIAHRFMVPRPEMQQSAQVMEAQHELMKELANRGDCIMVGRCADIILQELNPMNIFVYADQQSKLQRCRSRAEENEHFTEKEMLKRMKQIDKERAAYRELFTEDEWGRKESYHLCINTSGTDIKALIPAIAEYVSLWFTHR